MTRVFLCFRLVIAVMLMLALRDQSYEFYSLLRVLTTIAAFEVFYLAWTERKGHWAIPFAAIAVLWNPLREIELPEETWHTLDVAAAVLFAASIYYVTAVRLPSFGRTATPTVSLQNPVRLPVEGVDRENKTITSKALTELQQQILMRIDVSGWTIIEE